MGRIANTRPSQRHGQPAEGWRRPSLYFVPPLDVRNDSGLGPDKRPCLPLSCRQQRSPERIRFAHRIARRPARRRLRHHHPVDGRCADARPWTSPTPPFGRKNRSPRTAKVACCAQTAQQLPLEVGPQPFPGQPHLPCIAALIVGRNPKVPQKPQRRVGMQLSTSVLWLSPSSDQSRAL
ncbi:hypothetical protein LMG27174_06238 [Paraburkholderia rhynchosiae]|uniref:Uncharacterized protein n=1 Tax=Paraburkholderia rhynchosiae TaxID=487049 RepID=A0A6J5CJG9_9BURK|nr:hypothetical protein LMG27174_06238 [Paraburkholderia rhynchosiae]